MPPVVAQPAVPADIVYPETDGAPIAENALQFEAIVALTVGLEALFRDRPDVLVAGDLFWYPIEGQPALAMAPDAMVIFGRPKGPRGSYKQWEEGRIAPHVVFEVVSPSNRTGEMTRKFRFYERHGVEEYYLYNPEPAQFEITGYVRAGNELTEIPDMSGHVSPRLGVRFEVAGRSLRLIGPDGRPFPTYAEIARWASQGPALAAEVERLRAELNDKGTKRAE